MTHGYARKANCRRMWQTGLMLMIPSLLCCSDYARGEGASALVDKVKSGVVTILVYKTEESALPSSQGTGFFYDGNHLVTNWHVIDGAKRVIFRDANGKEYTVKSFRGVDKNCDLAVLVPPKNFSVQFSFSKQSFPLKVGQTVYVLGSPLGLGHSLSDGILSSTNRKLKDGVFHQLTAAISAGSSGSPVFNTKGEVLGVATLKNMRGESLNFAGPIENVAPLTKEKIRPVSEICKISTSTEPSLSKEERETLIGGLYHIVASRYLKECREQKTGRPSLILGQSDGSVGHLEKAEVFQVLSGGDALMKYGKEMFRLSGIDLSNVADKEYGNIGSLVLAQFSNYSYTAVSGARRTVYSVQALDPERLTLALNKLAKDDLTRIEALQKTCAKTDREIASLEKQLDALKSSGSAARIAELKKNIDMYSGATEGRPDIQKNVQEWKRELAQLTADPEVLAKHEQNMENLGVQLQKARAQQRLDSKELSRRIRYLPAYLTESLPRPANKWPRKWEISFQAQNIVVDARKERLARDIEDLKIRISSWEPSRSRQPSSRTRPPTRGQLKRQLKDAEEAYDKLLEGKRVVTPIYLPSLWILKHELPIGIVGTLEGRWTLYDRTDDGGVKIQQYVDSPRLKGRLKLTLRGAGARRVKQRGKTYIKGVWLLSKPRELESIDYEQWKTAYKEWKKWRGE